MTADGSVVALLLTLRVDQSATEGATHLALDRADKVTRKLLEMAAVHVVGEV